MPDRAVDLIKHFEAHIIKYERERVVQRCCARWHEFVNLFFSISIRPNIAKVAIASVEMSE